MALIAAEYFVVAAAVVAVPGMVRAAVGMVNFDYCSVGMVNLDCVDTVSFVVVDTVNSDLYSDSLMNYNRILVNAVACIVHRDLVWPV